MQREDVHTDEVEAACNSIQFGEDDESMYDSVSTELNEGPSQIFHEVTVTEKVEVPLKYLEEDVPEHVKKIFPQAKPTNSTAVAAIQTRDELVGTLKSLRRNTMRSEFIEVYTNDEAYAKFCEFLNKRLTTDHSLIRFPPCKKIAFRGLINSIASLTSAVRVY